MSKDELKELERTGYINSPKTVIAELDINGVHYEMPLCNLKNFINKTNKQRRNDEKLKK